MPDSPAAQIGLQVNDTVIEIEGEYIDSWDELVSMIVASEGNAIEIVYIRNGNTITQNVTPEIDNETGRPMIGIVPGIEKSVTAAVENGFAQTKLIFTEIMGFLQQLIRGQADTTDVAGPVGIITLVGQASRSGWIDVVGLAGLISINLGIMNLLPIPALDGSRIIFLLLEALRGKPVDPEKEAMVHMVGITLLMLLMVVITYKDIITFF